MVIVVCPAADSITTQSFNLNSSTPSRTQNSFPETAQHSATMFFQSNHQMTDGANMGPNFSFQLWLCSGRAGAAVQELKMVDQHGAQPSPVDLVTSWPANPQLPIAGRPFNWTTDSFRFITAGGQDAAFSQALSINAVLCQSGATGDCCAETLAKLDQIIAFVSKTYDLTP